LSRRSSVRNEGGLVRQCSGWLHHHLKSLRVALPQET